MKKYILSLDEGTTSARSILFDRDGNIISMAQNEFGQIYPKPGWVEQDPMEIYASQYAAMTECVAMSGISPDEIAGIGITNQRETTVIWDKTTGKPVYNAIVWQCRRTADICERLEKAGHSSVIRKKTGLKTDAYFSATKIMWILENVEGAREKAEKGELLFGTVDTWLLWKLTGGKVHVTDITNASRTMLFNIDTCRWDNDLLGIMNIPESMLPEVRSSSEIYAEIELMGAKIPVSGIAGDQQAALFGQCAFEKGEAKTTYGTGVFLLANTGSERVESSSGLITTLAATEKGERPEYVLEGSVFTGGSVVKWIRDELRLIGDAYDSEYFATKVPDSGGVYIVPAFTGLGAPHWSMHARGIMTGITRGTKREHIIRAALESVALQTNDVIRAMQNDLPGAVSCLKVDGGASSNGFLMQFQADISDMKVERPLCRETTALGAAFLAGLAVGFWKDREELKKVLKKDGEFIPEMEKEQRNGIVLGWDKAVKACINI